MSKFIKYENIDFRINNTVYYSNSVSISLQSNISPVLLSDGSLLRYAPENTVIGSLSSQFYLTGTVPSYLFPTDNSESSINCSFGGVSIDNCYLKSMSFAVADFSSIIMDVTFDWYGKINSANSTANIKEFTSSRNSPLTNLAHANHSYIIDVSNVFGFDEIFKYTYSEQCDRIPFFEVGYVTPFRVAKTNRLKNVSVEGNVAKQNNIAEVEGKNTYCELYLKNYSNSLLNTFTISGKIQSRSIDTSSDGIVQSNLAITQRVAPLRNTL
jgi:hypothetical protein